MDPQQRARLELLMLPDPLDTLNAIVHRPRWHADAACRDHSTALFFIGPGASSSAARAVCAVCPVRSPCLAYALGNQYLTGIWGGTSAHERSQMRRRRPAAETGSATA